VSHATNPDSDGATHNTAPIWFCSGWGLPCGICCQTPGALLPHPFSFSPLFGCKQQE